MSSSGLALARPAVRVEARAGGLPLGLIFGGSGLLGGALVALLDLDQLGVTVCALKLVTRLPCPTCGGTRAVGLLTRLDVLGALAMNPLVAAGALVLVPWFLADLLLLFRGRALDVSVSPGVARLLRLGVVAAFAANWLYLILVGR